MDSRKALKIEKQSVSDTIHDSDIKSEYDNHLSDELSRHLFE